MKSAFGDAGYWIAVLNPEDELHAKATAISTRFGALRIITSEMVLAEVLNGLSKKGADLRNLAARSIEQLRGDPNVVIVPQTSKQFRDALAFYAAHEDKQWGLTDCASFLLMRQRKLTQALTHDHHFVQAGFKALLREGA